MFVGYKPSFVRQFKKLPKDLQEEVSLKIELFKDVKNHSVLSVHKLKGVLKGKYSFSVNYRYRIVFIYESKDSVVLLSFGDHTVYKK